ADQVLGRIEIPSHLVDTRRRRAGIDRALHEADPKPCIARGEALLEGRSPQARVDEGGDDERYGRKERPPRKEPSTAPALDRKIERCGDEEDESGEAARAEEVDAVGGRRVPERAADVPRKEPREVVLEGDPEGNHPEHRGR